MSRVLPPHPSLEYLKKQAKELLHDFAEGHPAAVEKFSSHGLASASPNLADAQHVVAREYGFASGAKLKEYVQSLAASFDPVNTLVAAVNTNGDEKVAQLLQQHPELKSKLNDPLPG